MDDLWERNRRLLAERLHWPGGALEVAECIERMFPAYSVYWGTGRIGSPQPGFYAIRCDNAWPRQGELFGRLADDLIATIQIDMARVAAEKEAFRKMTRYSWQ